jgi:hypothetical protein
MKIARMFAALLACLAGISMAGGAAPEKVPPGASPTAGKPSAGIKVDRTSRPKKVSAGQCVNQNGAVCLLSVKIGPKCDVTVEPDALFIRQKGATNLVWEISGPGSFAERDGIKFKSGDAPFSDGHAVGKNRWMANHQPRDPAVYRYGLNLLDGSGQPCVVDPVIVDDY